MESQITIFITLAATSGVLSVFLGLYAFLKRKSVPSASLFVLYNAALAIYIFGYAFELASDTLAEIKRWIVVEYVGMPFSVVLGLLLVMRYTGRTVARKAAAAMFVIPAITLAMVATNDFHHLFYQSIYLRESSPKPLVDIAVGEWYIVHGAYTFGCLLAGFVLLLRRWKQTKKTYRLQLAVLILSQIVPILAAFLYLMGVTPQGMDPVPVVLCLTSAMYIWAIVTSRMLTIVPIAKDSIFESMKEGVIVLDAAGRIVDFNRALGEMLPAFGSRVIGKTLDEAWIGMTGTAFPAVRSLDGAEEELQWTNGGRAATYLVRSSTVTSKRGDSLGTLLMLIDVTEQKRLEDRLRQLAYYDGLTQLLNRTQFLLRGKKMLEEAQSSGSPFSLVLFDIDHFKRINDTYGHETGDRALVFAVSAIRRLLSPDMLFARYGGEEFAICLPRTGIEAAGALADRLRIALSSEPLETQNARVRITASFGVAQIAEGADTLESLLRDADAALYESKRNGRNAVSLRAETV